MARVFSCHLPRLHGTRHLQHKRHHQYSAPPYTPLERIDYSPRNNNGSLAEPHRRATLTASLAKARNQPSFWTCAFASPRYSCRFALFALDPIALYCIFISQISNYVKHFCHQPCPRMVLGNGQQAKGFAAAARIEHQDASNTLVTGHVWLTEDDDIHDPIAPKPCTSITRWHLGYVEESYLC